MEICVDFDGTIVTHEYPEVGEPIPGALSVLWGLLRNGHDLILFTMRSGEELKEAVNYLKGHGVHLYGVNKNPTQDDWTESPKAYGQLYIDDAALGTPLVENHPLSDRPFVDWEEVEKALKDKGII